MKSIEFLRNIKDLSIYDQLKDSIAICHKYNIIVKSYIANGVGAIQFFRNIQENVMKLAGMFYQTC